MWTQLAPSLEHGMQQSEKASQVLKMMMMMSAGCSRVPLSKLQQLLQCKLLAKNNIDLECKLMITRIMAEEVHGSKRRSLLCLIMDHSSCT
jgi:hypothetical protein